MKDNNKTSSHRTYLEKMINGLKELCSREPSAKERLLQESELVLSVAVLDLEPIRERLESYYSPQQEEKGAYDPCAMFRSFVVLSKLGKYSLRQWPEHLKGHPEIALLCGFSLAQIAQKTCHYDFCKRLLNGPYQKECVHEPRASRALEGRGANFVRHLSQEKELAKEELKAAKLEPDEQRVKQAVREALERRNNELPPTFIQRMNELLWDCAVIPSIRTYLEEGLRELALSGDSAAIYSQASSRGKSTCNCKQEGKENCECPRRYADPEATWGYDSKEEKYFFGHRLHTLDTRVGNVDLPLYVAVTDAHTPDVVVAVENLPHLLQLCERANHELSKKALSTEVEKMYQSLVPTDEMVPENRDGSGSGQSTQKNEEQQAELGKMIKKVLAPAQNIKANCNGCTGSCEQPILTTETPSTSEPNNATEQMTNQVRVVAGIFDKAFDATEFYRFLHKLKVSPIIPLRVAPKMNANEMPRNKLGIPLCKAGLAMKFHGTNKKRLQSIYHCPVKYVGREKGKLKFKVRPEGCPLGQLCEPESVMGPLVYLPLDENHRLNVPVPRDSERFAELMAKRTGSERLYSQRKSLGYFSRPYRRRYLYQITDIVFAAGCHARAWVWERWGKAPVKSLTELFGRLDEVLEMYKQKEANNP